ncbi:FadR/GntR family transcriptional regulator [Streptomyces sp. NPDC002285]
MSETSQSYGAVTAAEHVQWQLVRMINLGRLQPGERLPAAEVLASTFDVSRPIVLQALKALREQGRLRVRRGGGTWVAPLSEENSDARRAQVWQRRPEIRQMCAMREMLEVGFARRLAVHGLPRDLEQRAWQLIEEMRSTSSEDSAKDIHRKLDSDFHSLLYRALDMPLIETTLVDARAIVASTFEFLSWPADRAFQSTSEHEELLRAVLARDEEGAVRAALKHISVASELVEELLRDDGTVLFSAPRRNR